MIWPPVFRGGHAAVPAQPPEPLFGVSGDVGAGGLVGSVRVGGVRGSGGGRCGGCGGRSCCEWVIVRVALGGRSNLRLQPGQNYGVGTTQLQWSSL